jgi:guanylate kinase
MEHSERKIAEGLLSIRAVFFRPDEPFTWASGIKSPIYCDNRLILTAPEARNEVEQAIARGKVCFLIIEVQGAKNVMRICPDCVSIFLYPPNFEILEQRLRGRMSETDEVIRNRLEIAKVELQSRDCYKYQVLNDDLDTAVHEINHIICDELAKRNAE